MVKVMIGTGGKVGIGADAAYRCTRCGKSFGSKKELASHILIHER